MPTIPLKGWAPLFDGRRAQINEKLREYGAGIGLVQKFANELTGREADLQRRFMDAVKHDPRYEALLEHVVVGSEEWRTQTVKIAEEVNVAVNFTSHGATGTIAVAVGQGFPVFAVNG